MRSIRAKILCGIVPGAMVLGALGVVNMTHTSTNSAVIPGLGITRAQAMEMKSAAMKGALDPGVQRPTKATKAGEPPLGDGSDNGDTVSPTASSAAQLAAERQFQGHPIGAEQITNAVNQYNLVSDATVPTRWTSLGPDNSPKANNPDPITGAQTGASGRISAIAVVASTCTATGCGTIYAGPANGGLWKSTDFGAHWTELMDHTNVPRGVSQLNESIGYIAIDPVNSSIIYVGTGESNASGDTNRGIGLLRSTDGGNTWTQLDRNDFVNRSISKIIIDPRTAGSTNATLYVSSFRAIDGSDYSQSAGCSRCTPNMPALGFYKSTDGGSTFAYQNPSVAGTLAGSQSLVMDPTNPNILYLGISGDTSPAVNSPSPNGSVGRGVYRSTDDGTTWTKLNAGTSGMPTASIQNVQIGISAAAPNTLYVAYGRTNTSPSHEEIFKTTNVNGSPATWTKLSVPNACGGQCSYDMPIAVDQTNANVVYAGGVANYDWVFGGNPACYNFYPFPVNCQTSLMRTDDGGLTWRDIAENQAAGNGLMHPDNHAITLAPGHQNVVLDGSDGGLLASTNSGGTWSDLNSGLDTLQAESLAVGPTGNIFFGTQDNGTYRLTPGSTTSVHVGYGDGGVSNVDPVDPNFAYVTQYGGFMERADGYANAPASSYPNPFANGGGGVFISPAWYDYYLNRALFYSPNAVSAANHNDVYQGQDALFRNTMKGGLDMNGDGDATWDPAGTPPAQQDKTDWAPISPNLPGGSWISAIAPSPTDANTLAFGTSSGRVFITHNALAAVTTTASPGRSCDIHLDPLNSLDGCHFVSGVNWTEISTGLPGRWITALKFDPKGSGKLFTTASSFGVFTPSNVGHVFSLDAGSTTWNRIDGQNFVNGRLPDMPTNDIVISPRTGFLYVSMDFGVFLSTNGGQSWMRWDYGLPNVPIYMMGYDPTTNNLVVSTHGRGIWEALAP